MTRTDNALLRLRLLMVLGLLVVMAAIASAAAPASAPAKADAPTTPSAPAKAETPAAAPAELPARPVESPVATWDAKLLAYERPKTLVVEESTPTAEQVAFLVRPPQEKTDAPDPKATGPATPRVSGPFNVIHLRFRDATGDIVPAVLCTPKDAKGPFPLVVAIHGLTSNKAQVCAQVGPVLAAKGFAVLAFDLPFHGERPGTPLSILNAANIFTNFRKASINARQCIDLAKARPEIDHKAGVTLVGYSLGSWVSSITGPADPRVKAVVLMVGGTFDMPGMAERNPQMAAISAGQAIPHLAPRPLLMLNGKSDNLVSPESAKRLFAAAGEPKKQIWYDGGHMLPAAAYTDAADWIDKTIRPPAK